MKKILIKYIALGLGMLVIFNIVLFIISLIFGFEGTESGPTLLAAIVFAFIMCMISYLLVTLLKPGSLVEGLSYSLTWTAIVFGLTLVVTIANDTTKIFFGEWFNYLSFVAMIVAPVMVSYKKNQ